MPSQFGQDRFVIELLEGMHGGFFLDSGAADGLRASNTHLLESHYGWQGICVEPNRQMYASLVRNRHCHCVNCCLYDKDGDVEFVETAQTLGGILETYHPQLLEHACRTYRVPTDQTGKPITVLRPARTIRSILRQFNAPRVIDYWSLDTEGSELIILKSFPFDEYAFRVLTVEHNRYAAREEILRFLEERGYRRIRTFEIDDCFIKEAREGELAWRSKAFSRFRRARLS